ncbi:MAG: YjbH domain-containing protein [Chlamydiales bacterium]|nr:YjbH domain-containing protein [Chlamydiales bacterium]
MRGSIILLIFFFSLLSSFLFSEEEYLEEYVPHRTSSSPDLFRDLDIVAECEKRNCDKLPLIYSHYGHVGYFNMPSARMGDDGDITLGASSVPPYRNYFIGFQLFSRIEMSGVYRVFKGVQDVILSPHGFGDYADKGANIKINLLKPADTEYCLPGIALGLEDFLGSQLFESKYVVLTQEWPNLNFEASFGYGTGRIGGFFGGIAYSPWRKCENYWNGLSFVAEYDPTDYENSKVELHPFGRVKKFPINYGIKYAIGKYWRFSVSHIRGNNIAYEASGTFDLGSVKGFFPKINDPLCYFAPINTEPISPLRPLNTLVEDLAYALDNQGFTLLKATLEKGCNPLPILRLRIVNRKYLYETDVHKRLGCLLALLTPVNVSEVIVVISADCVLCQEYRYSRRSLYLYASRQMTDIELATVSPIREVTFPKYCPEILFERREKALEWGLRPRAQTFFGSSKGKLKYEIDGAAVVEGFVWYDVYYKFLLSHTLLTNANDLGNFDMLNPSPVINVNSDRITYYQVRDFKFEQVYLQRSWTHGCGLHSRVAAGFFDIAYGGVAAEALYYPVNSSWAVGLAGAIVKKRTYNDWGFQNKLRRFVGSGTSFYPVYDHYTVLSQYFLDIYYRFNTMPVSFKISMGQFLARDFGIRTEVFRYFPSGLRISFWYTYTNGNDRVNGSVYHDKGISFSMPLDVIFKESSRARWGYGMSAWLRDVGYRVGTGNELYPVLFEQRDNPVTFDKCN